MKSPKSESFSVTQNQLASVFKALGCKTRLSILDFLVSNPNSNCMRIVAALTHSQSTISKHLSELKSANIVQTSYIDAVLVYQVNKDFIATIQHYLVEMFSNLQHQNLENITQTETIEKFTQAKKGSYSKLKEHNYVFAKNKKKL